MITSTANLIQHTVVSFLGIIDDIMFDYHS